MHIEDLVVSAHAAAVLKGFASDGKRRPVSEHVALMMTELGELYEAHRDGFTPAEHLYEGQTGVSREHNDQTPKPVGIPSELADLVIRACDMAGEYGIDLEKAIEEKLRYNRSRPYKHGRQS